MKPPPPVTRTFAPPADTATWNPTRMPPGELSPALRSAALSLRVDAVTTEVVSKLRSGGVRPILLKGPSIATWLYEDGTPRPYRDTDLLVAPEALRAASGALRGLGFREQPGVSSYTWFRRSDRSVVDLHDTLFGVEADPDHAWAVLSEGTETMRIGALEVETLGRPARLLYVVLHAAQHESHRFEQPLKDLERALHHAEEQPWTEAANLASQLRAGPTFAAGLRLLPDGGSLANRMGLGDERPLMLALRGQGERSLVVTLERLASAPGLGARLRLLARRLAPPPDYMRWRYRGLAGRGTAGLALAYLWRPASVALRLPGAIVAWRRARRAAGNRPP
jgi:putative nucleotidyltransferase-like protein